MLSVRCIRNLFPDRTDYFFREGDMCTIVRTHSRGGLTIRDRKGEDHELGSFYVQYFKPIKRKVERMETIIKKTMTKTSDGRYMWTLKSKFYTYGSVWKFKTIASAEASMKAFVVKRGMEILKPKSMNDIPKPESKKAVYTPADGSLEKAIMNVLTATQEMLKVVSKAKK